MIRLSWCIKGKSEKAVRDCSNGLLARSELLNKSYYNYQLPLWAAVGELAAAVAFVLLFAGIKIQVFTRLEMSKL